MSELHLAEPVPVLGSTICRHCRQRIKRVISPPYPVWVHVATKSPTGVTPEPLS